MPSVQQIIKGHNQIVLKKSAQPTYDQAERTRNCRKKEECMLEGNCLAKGVVYQAQVTASRKTDTYVGLTCTRNLKLGSETTKCHSAGKHTRTTRNLTSTSGSLKAKNNTSPSNGRSWPRQTLLKPDKAMQSMYNGEAFHHHQTRIGNIKQTQ